tara:strand:+ start:9208 stop:9888 length:681 start_codon:yes stop_codon:yes gene_type:complete
MNDLYQIDAEIEMDSEITSSDSDTDSDNISSYSDEESEYSSGGIFINTQTDDAYDHIYDQDEQHVLSDKIHNKYYIGQCYKFKEELNDVCSSDNIFLSISVSPITFFRHSYSDIMNYLTIFGSFNCFNYYSNLFNRNSTQNIDIMKTIVIENDNYQVYTVILKTYWLRLIQRHWKKVYKQQHCIIRQRCKIKNMRYREIHGTYPEKIARLPGLKGLLNCYLKKYLQ